MRSTTAASSRPTMRALVPVRSAKTETTTESVFLVRNFRRVRARRYVPGAVAATVYPCWVASATSWAAASPADRPCSSTSCS
jgi:hypothetical protein